MTRMTRATFGMLCMYVLNGATGAAWSEPAPLRVERSTSQRALNTAKESELSPSRILATSARRQSALHRGSVARSAVEAFAQGGLPRQLAQVRLYPERRRGRFIGFKLQRIQANSLAAQVGLREGDVIVSVNGEPIGRPDQMMHVLSQLPYAPKLKLSLIRGGERIDWVWDILPS